MRPPYRLPVLAQLMQRTSISSRSLLNFASRPSRGAIAAAHRSRTRTMASLHRPSSVATAASVPVKCVPRARSRARPASRRPSLNSHHPRQSLGRAHRRRAQGRQRYRLPVELGPPYERTAATGPRSRLPRPWRDAVRPPLSAAGPAPAHVQERRVEIN
jgi:hypothetical protein